MRRMVTVDEIGAVCAGVRIECYIPRAGPCLMFRIYSEYAASGVCGIFPTPLLSRGLSLDWIWS